MRSGIAQAPAPALRVMVVATANGRQSRAVAATLTNVDPVSLAAQCQTLARQALLRASLRAALASQEALRARAPVNSRSLVAYSQPPAGQGFALVQAVGRYAAAAPAKAETHRVVRVLAEGPVWDGQDIKSWVCVLLTHDGFTITAKRVNTETGQWEVSASIHTHTACKNMTACKNSDAHTHTHTRTRARARARAQRCRVKLKTTAA